MSSNLDNARLGLQMATGTEMAESAEAAGNLHTQLPLRISTPDSRAVKCCNNLLRLKLPSTRQMLLALLEQSRNQPNHVSRSVLDMSLILAVSVTVRCPDCGSSDYHIDTELSQSVPLKSWGFTWARRYADEGRSVEFSNQGVAGMVFDPTAPYEQR